MAKVLIVDDDTNTLASLARAFRLAGHEAEVAQEAARALDLARSGEVDVMLSDVVMPDKDGITLLEEIRAAGITIPVIMISGQATVEMAVRATRLGAADFLEKPLSTERLLMTVDNALRLNRLEQENRELRRRVGSTEMIGASEPMLRLGRQIDRVAPSETRVCILGETGTGKELVARAIHEKSARARGPFVTLNCAAVPAELIESELFGHEKGSFTGAATRHLGKFEQAHRGTLFLDEIGDMPLPMQAKLLRVLQEGEVERLGGGKPVRVDVRTVVATHRDLYELVRGGQFREDLFHRVYVMPLALPPLRERPGDLQRLLEYFIARISEINGWKPKPVSTEAMAALGRYHWPGNVRELRNVAERLMLLADDLIDEHVVAISLPGAKASPAHTPAAGSLFDRISQFERSTILAELESRAFRMAETARALGLERSHLYKKCEQLGIDLKALREARN